MKRFIGYRFLAVLFCLILGLSSLGAKVVMPNIFSDHMVLQQSSNVALWGTAEANSTVAIKASWAKMIDSPAKLKVQADENGKWMARIQTPTAGGPYELTISDKSSELIFKDVMIGEVWFCSGQSNMEMTMSGFQSQPIEGAADYILSAKPSRPIRMINIKRAASFDAKDNIEGIWLEHTPENVAKTSATAYFFAEMLQKTIDVPIGIINASWGGTPIEAWMQKEVIEKDFKEFSLKEVNEKKAGKKSISHLPSLLFNGMVAPIIPYTLKGMIWYQGEANRSRPEQYTRLQPAYVQMMRDCWEDQKMPFYFVQIAPYSYNKPQDIAAAVFRDAQAATLKTIPHSGMAVTLDIGDTGCIHPAKKKEVGERLAFLALANDYGFKMIDANPPMYKSMEVKDNQAILTFTCGERGIAPLGKNLACTIVDGKAFPCFEVAGEDGIFYPATSALIERPNKLVVVSDKVQKPVAVRYCYHNEAYGVLFNSYGVPASSFTTE